MEALRIVSLLKNVLRRADPRWPARLTQLLLGPLFQTSLNSSWNLFQSAMAEFCRIAEPLPLDPRWHRLWALLWEGPLQESGEALRAWDRYCGDVEQNPQIPEDLRPRVQAIALRRMAEISTPTETNPEEMISRLLGEETPAREFPDDAARYLAMSRERDPTQKETYEAQIDLYREHNRFDDAVCAALDLLVRFPEDIPTLEFLANEYARREDPDAVQNVLDRRIELKPLDAGYANRRNWNYLAITRHRALKKRWHEGREALARFNSQGLSPAERLGLLARSAVLELKAGDREKSEALLAEASQAPELLAPLWLATAIEATRYELPLTERKRFRALRYAALKKAFNGATAGALAHIMAAYVASDTDYPGRGSDTKAVLKYVKKSATCRLMEADLASVCVFLFHDGGDLRLLERLAARGLKQAPQNCEFLFLSAQLELKKGPFAADSSLARRRLEKVLEVVETPRNDREAQIVELARVTLPLVESFERSQEEMPFGALGGFGKGINLFDLFGMESPDLDDDGFYEPAPAQRKSNKRSR